MLINLILETYTTHEIFAFATLLAFGLLSIAWAIWVLSPGPEEDPEWAAYRRATLAEAERLRGLKR